MHIYIPVCAPACVCVHICSFIHASNMHSFVPCRSHAYSLFHAIHFVSFLPGSTQTVRGVTEVTAGSLLDDDQWHDVIIKRDRHKLKVVVDRLVNELETNGLFYRLDLDKYVRIH